MLRYELLYSAWAAGTSSPRVVGAKPCDSDLPREMPKLSSRLYGAAQFSDALSQTRHRLPGKVAGNESGDGIKPTGDGNDLRLEPEAECVATRVDLVSGAVVWVSNASLVVADATGVIPPQSIC